MALRSARLKIGTVALALGAALMLGLMLCQGQAQPAQAQATAAPDRAAVVRGFLNALNAWDVDGQVAAFAGNAVFIGARATGNCSQQTPCTDSAGIRQQAQGNIAIHPCYTLRAIQVSGAVVTGQLEVSSDTSRANGVPRTLQDFIALVPVDKITFFANLNDAGDPMTALNAAINAGTEPGGTPIANPTSPCSG